MQMEVLFCGVCHSDLHQARNEWKNTVYPVVPGHEIVGRVTAVGPQVLEVQGRRPRRRELPRRFVPHLCELRGRPRTVLRERLRRHL
ncbi:MAG: Alcohol dehydrogenase (EC [uncultured Paraburkholderia sp.]|nr:MAG: Alcohol dehydrogenase (EC [uncultured Paraburkholderia sp.]CAH2933083.1 MAG: Alcohol dehydrogenase (EC [uncultured Paraburkholderia sp.]